MIIIACDVELSTRHIDEEEQTDLHKIVNVHRLVKLTLDSLGCEGDSDELVPLDDSDTWRKALAKQNQYRGKKVPVKVPVRAKFLECAKVQTLRKKPSDFCQRTVLYFKAANIHMLLFAFNTVT